MDLINLPYPLFVTTDEEKELLKAILPMFKDKLKPTTGLCAALDSLDTCESFLLSNRTCNAFDQVYLQAYFRKESNEFADYEQSYVMDSVSKRLMYKRLRVIWINKLLNYKE
jgi:hypothetical protein